MLQHYNHCGMVAAKELSIDTGVQHNLVIHSPPRRHPIVLPCK